MERQPQFRCQGRMEELIWAEAVGRAHGDVFGAIRPAATMVVVAALLDQGWKVEIEAEAVVA